jgi:hypothetical protein
MQQRWLVTKYSSSIKNVFVNCESRWIGQSIMGVDD